MAEPAAAENEAPKEEHLNIRFKDDRDQEIYFKLKPTTLLWKAVTAYCRQQGVDETTLRFFFDNQRIVKTDTPQSLEMEDGDQVDVHTFQKGGTGAEDEIDAEDTTANKLEATRLTIIVKDQQEGEMEFRLKSITPLSICP
jgi:small ubiquitin-related modifier